MKLRIILIFMTVTVVFALTSCTSMDRLPQGELIDTSCSPNGTYRIDTFLVSGNATVDFSIRCEVVEIFSGESRNIYWEYRCESADIKWIDDVVVEINGKPLNVLTDSYDWRN